MPLTALQHQKAAALQQISALAHPGGMADPAMMKNAVNRMAPLISQWERSDPEFAQLGMLLRRARVKPTPNTLAMVSAQAQRMVSLLRTGLPHRTNRAGEKQVWDPGRGHVTSPMFEEGEPLRTFSPMGWRGSKKYPFGKAFPEEGFSGIQRPGFLAGFEGEVQGFGFFKRIAHRPVHLARKASRRIRSTAKKSVAQARRSASQMQRIAKRGAAQAQRSASQVQSVAKKSARLAQKNC